MGDTFMDRWSFLLRQHLKMLLHNVILPLIYGFWSFVYRSREKKLIIFADSHHDQCPISMEYLHRVMMQRGYSLTDVFCNYAAMSQVRAAWRAMGFMRLYAQAKYVFICDNFLPVSACKKDPETTVVQLWHACGLVKKMGRDTQEDIPRGYKGNVYRNYDLVTVSAPCCVEPMAKAMGLPESVLQPLGISRTDVYFDPAWREQCRKAFYQQHPQAKEKKVVLWAPTFRGSASDPYQIGMEAIDRLQRQLGEDYYLIRKLHPHLARKMTVSDSNIPTEQLLPVADLLITDYSSVLTESLFFEKPCLLFAPDLEEYEQKRGFYEPYHSLSPYVVTNEADLYDACMQALQQPNLPWLRRLREYHLACCDGRSTERILAALGL